MSRHEQSLGYPGMNAEFQRIVSLHPRFRISSSGEGSDNNTYLITGELIISASFGDYLLPIHIVAPPGYPNVHPIVKLNMSMISVKEVDLKCPYVNKSGDILHPYLSSWSNQKYPTILKLLDYLRKAFAQHSPTYGPKTLPSPTVKIPETPPVVPLKVPVVSVGKNDGIPPKISGKVRIPEKVLTAESQTTSTRVPQYLPSKEYIGNLCEKVTHSENVLSKKKKTHASLEILESFIKNNEIRITTELCYLSEKFVQVKNNTKLALLEMERLRNKRDTIIEFRYKITNIMDSINSDTKPTDLVSNVDPCKLIIGDSSNSAMIFKLLARDIAISDTIYILHKALSKQIISLDAFIREIKTLAGDQLRSRLIFNYLKYGKIPEALAI